MDGVFFQWFTIGYCINKGRLSITNLSSENNFTANCHILQSSFGLKWTLLFKYSHALVRIHVIGGQRSVRVVPLFRLLFMAVQQKGTSSPPSWLKCSSGNVIWICRTSFTNSSCPLPNGPPWLSLPGGLDGGSPMHALLQLISLCILQSVHGYKESTWFALLHFHPDDNWVELSVKLFSSSSW